MSSPIEIKTVLLPQEKVIFGGLDETLGKSTGRIYKRENPNGIPTFFRAQGFLSSIYHFLFSKRLNHQDLENLHLRVKKHVDESKDISSKARVEAIFFGKILGQLPDKPELKLSMQEILNDPSHKAILEGAAEKIVNFQRSVSDPNHRITWGEYFFLNQIARADPNIRMQLDLPIKQAIDMMQQGGANPVINGVQSLVNKSGAYKTVDVATMQQKVKLNQLDQTERRLLETADREMKFLRDKTKDYLALDGFLETIPGLQQLLELSKMKEQAEGLAGKSTMSTVSQNIQSDQQKLEEAARKLMQLDQIWSIGGGDETGKKKVIFTAHEYDLLDHLVNSDAAKLSTFPSDVQAAVSILKNPMNPFRSVMTYLEKEVPQFAKADVRTCQDLALNNLLDQQQIELILRAKDCMRQITGRSQGFLDLKSFMSKFPGLKELMDLSEINNPQIQRVQEGPRA